MSSSIQTTLCLPPREIFSQRAEIKVIPGSILLFGVFEQRSEVDPNWLSIFGDENIYEVISGNDLLWTKIPKFDDKRISLRNQEDLHDFFKQINPPSIYLDITGLPHHVWMPLLRICLEARIDTHCIYVEPKSYTGNPTPKPGEFFDLSEKIRGFSPIPTFARINVRREEETKLIPLLGFEGTRFSHLIETIEPNERDVSPIIGVPGFELEYPFHTFEGNAYILNKTRSWVRIYFVDATCPFSLYLMLTMIHGDCQHGNLQVATIGTKPHALGAVLYAINNTNVELLYDHPIRKRARTTGMAKCHLYHVSDFMSQL